MLDAAASAILASEGQDAAFALAFPAMKDAFSALVNVVTVLARRVAIIE
jgi:hypothetical protein